MDNYCACAVQRSFACIFNKLPVVRQFLLAFDGASTRTDHFTSGKKYRKLVNNVIFIHRLGKIPNVSYVF